MPDIQHQATREYTKSPGTAYSLPHDEEERWRLTTQNNLLLRATDNRALHAPVKLTDDDWVLETGTGTGIWLQDLAKEISSKPRFIGTDIEACLFPDPTTLPQNMRFEVQSVLELPSHWTDKFTLIHQRFLIPGLRESEWPHALDELYRVLKPGGCIQFVEVGYWKSGPALAKFCEMLFELSDERGQMWRNLTSRLPDLLKQSGFVNIHQKPITTPLCYQAGQDGIDGRDNLLSGCRGLKTPILKAGGYGAVKSELEYDELVSEIRNECDNIPESHSLWVMFWAQKPSLSVRHQSAN